MSTKLAHAKKIEIIDKENNVIVLCFGDKVLRDVTK